MARKIVISSLVFFICLFTSGTGADDEPKKVMKFIIPIGVSYDSDLSKVREVTLEVAKEILATIPGGDNTFDPILRFSQFSDFSINFNVVLQCNEFMDQFIIRDQFIERIHKKYKEENITIPFPIRTIEIKKDN